MSGPDKKTHRICAHRKIVLRNYNKMPHTNASCAAVDTLKNFKQMIFFYRLKSLKAIPQYYLIQNQPLFQIKNTQKNIEQRKPKAKELHSQHHIITSSTDILSTLLLALFITHQQKQKRITLQQQYGHCPQDLPFVHVYGQAYVYDG
ncbi:Uncharacterised protein [Candidatus Bartonella washoeensis]|uniref:Uncharacterized protein n=1 Tax=Candidatus Bartonella washoeensis Sb944nv TaxID=1094563 RepID=J0Q2S9_9HYPH|nr:hypothetical protein MCQ_00902 [Bartonella washoeensis Sb944nv]SPU27511.1 Uncharacterised protein [Bartonella washoeensis]